MTPMIGWMKSSRPWRILRSLDPMNVWTASFLSALLFSGVAVMGIKWMEADPQGAVITCTFCAIISACILIAEGENRDRNKL
ncbi:hypothetical protein SEA_PERCASTROPHE_71 [Streptomyces phage Percastrophe]|uniref:Uncharacterized protein n=1 Tax=Streptomyces phage Percastrophe TaxID=2060087 RepID=A0A2H5BM86_9CAUD|nr:hypothetical protein SEA_PERCASTROPHE_71 [Streptomyces phage Percastrophe]